MPSREEIVRHGSEEPPPGASPWVPGVVPTTRLELVAYDPGWPDRYATLADRVREALGWRVLSLDHVGSTSVPGLAAKPIVDAVLVVADPAEEPAYLPALETVGFTLRVREPWWYEHRTMRHEDPRANLHVFGPDAPEPIRMRLFRDWLRAHPHERQRYALAKADALAATTAVGEHVMQYNARKQAVVREIYDRAFRAAGLL